VHRAVDIRAVDCQEDVTPVCCQGDCPLLAGQLLVDCLSQVDRRLVRSDVRRLLEAGYSEGIRRHQLQVWLKVVCLRDDQDPESCSTGPDWADRSTDALLTVCPLMDVTVWPKDDRQTVCPLMDDCSVDSPMTDDLVDSSMGCDLWMVVD